MTKRILSVKAELLCIEDGVVNNIDDITTEQALQGATPLMPFVKREGNTFFWCPDIDVETGKIVSWPAGTTASTCYKVVDECTLSYSEDGVRKGCPSKGYVPDSLCRDDNGYGDYMDLTINEDGQIENWDKDLCLSDIANIFHI